jgi:soluble lytic murein transglycosylase
MNVWPASPIGADRRVSPSVRLLCSLALLLSLLSAAAAAAAAADSRLAAYAALRKAPQESAATIAGLRDLAVGDFILADYAAFDLVGALAAAGADDEAARAARELADRRPVGPLTHAANERYLRLVCADPAADRCGAGLNRVTGSDVTDEGRPWLAWLAAERLRATGSDGAAYRAYQKVYYGYPISPYAEKGRQATVALRRMNGNRAAYPAPTYRQRMGRVERLTKAYAYKKAESDLLRMGAAAYSAERQGEILYRLATVRRQAREKAAARTTYLTYLERYPRGKDAYRAAYYVAILDWNREANDEASARLTELASSKKTPAELRRSAWLVLGRIAEEGGDFAVALDHYDQALAIRARATNMAEVMWRRAWLLYRLDRFDEARGLFAAADKKTPDKDRDGRFLYWGAVAAERSGDLKEAARLRERLLREFPHTYYGAMRRLAVGRVALTTPSGDDGSVRTYLLDYEKRAGLDGHARAHLERYAGLVALGMSRAARVELDYLSLRMKEKTPDDALWLGSLYREADGVGRSLTLQGIFLDAREKRDDFDHPFWRLYYPLDHWETVVACAAAARLDPFLALSIIRQESAFNVDATSSADARGLMQLLPSTGEQVYNRLGFDKAHGAFDAEALYRPELNIPLGITYFAGLLARYHGSLPHALAAYNAGEDAVDRWRARYGDLPEAAFVEMIPYRETRGYVKKILRNLALYHVIYGGENDLPPAVAAAERDL